MIPGLCNGIKKKETYNRKNRYPWIKCEEEVISCTYECYLTKKSFGNTTDGGKCRIKMRVVFCNHT